jgi:hypothetical protein
VQLAQDVVDVVLHRWQFDVEEQADLLVREPLLDELQHLALAGRQVRCRRAAGATGQGGDVAQ